MTGDPGRFSPRYLVPRAIGYTSLTGYLVWNVYWLSRGRLPPSILLELTGVPVPTTGFTRSWISLFRGNWGDFFLWNPFSIPLVVLLVLSAASLGRSYLRGRPLLLEKPLAWGWLIVLAAAWVTKLAMGSAWW
jgi:hypothetical protein